MSKHTPGPLEARKGDVLNSDRSWGVVRVMSREECAEIDGDESCYGSRTEIVAEICPADNGQDEADAKLYAAAPDLLKACKLVLRIVEPLDDPERWGGIVCRRLRAAIAKAEGRAL